MAKRRRSSAGENQVSKKVRVFEEPDLLSDLSDELLIRILHLLPLATLLHCQRISHRLYTLASDSQLWKNLYYNRFVLPRALRIPGVKAGQPEHTRFSSRRSKWLDDEALVNRVDGKKTDWKGQYKLRHNWSIGACEVKEVHVAQKCSDPAMLVRLAESVVITADKEGLKVWDLKKDTLVASQTFEKGIVPTCLAIDEKDLDSRGVEIAVGFKTGGWGFWKLDKKTITQLYIHPPSSNGRLSAVALVYPFLFTATDAQLLSLYTFAFKPPSTKLGENDVHDDAPVLDIPEDCTQAVEDSDATNMEDTLKPRLLASLQSHSSWPPIALSLRTTPSTLIASIAYSLPTYLSGYTLGLQELHLNLVTSAITSRLTTALPQGFSSISLSPQASPSPQQTHTSPPTSLSYSHPYLLATHPDNTLTLHLCTSTADSLSLSPGTTLWGHTSAPSSAAITARGKAVSLSLRGEVRVWELEGVKKWKGGERSVRVRDGGGTEGEKRWVGFDDEVVIVLKEDENGGQGLMIYDFT